MAGASLIALLDDIATMLDDVAVMTKTAATKTAGVVGDDLAVNAEQATGVAAARELPVVFAVARGSALNKAILVPAALAISAFAPWLITPLLMVGGAYLCFEAAEKLWHALSHSKVDPGHGPLDDPGEEEVPPPPPGETADQVEARKVKGAVRTDFVLSAEIVVLALGVVADRPFATQVMTLAVVAVAMTVGVYGLVALIVKLDDAGLWLMARPGSTAGIKAVHALGRVMVGAMPWLMKGLAVAGTLAMFLVGGGILAHAIHGLQEAITAALGDGLLRGLVMNLVNLVAGVAAGFAVMGVAKGVARLRRR